MHANQPSAGNVLGAIQALKAGSFNSNGMVILTRAPFLDTPAGAKFDFRRRYTLLVPDANGENPGFGIDLLDTARKYGLNDPRLMAMLMQLDPVAIPGGIPIDLFAGYSTMNIDTNSGAEYTLNSVGNLDFNSGLAGLSENDTGVQVMSTPDPGTVVSDRPYAVGTDGITRPFDWYPADLPPRVIVSPPSPQALAMIAPPGQSFLVFSKLDTWTWVPAERINDADLLASGFVPVRFPWPPGLRITSTGASVTEINGWIPKRFANPTQATKIIWAFPVKPLIPTYESGPATPRYVYAGPTLPTTDGQAFAAAETWIRAASTAPKSGVSQRSVPVPDAGTYYLQVGGVTGGPVLQEAGDPYKPKSSTVLTDVHPVVASQYNQWPGIIPAQQWTLSPQSDGTYEITNVATGDALQETLESSTAGGSGFNVVASPASWNSAEQRWSYLTQPDGTAGFVNVAHGGFLEPTATGYLNASNAAVAGVTDVDASSDDDQDAFTGSGWNLVPASQTPTTTPPTPAAPALDDGIYHLTTSDGSSYLQEAGDSYTGPSAVSGSHPVVDSPTSWASLYFGTAGVEQQWAITQDPNGHYTVENLDSGNYLTATSDPAASGDPGAASLIATPAAATQAGTAAQEWDPTRQPDGGFTFTNTATGQQLQTSSQGFDNIPGVTAAETQTPTTPTPANRTWTLQPTS